MNAGAARRRHRLGLVLLLLVLAGPAGAAVEVQLQAILDPQLVTVDEAVTLTILVTWVRGLPSAPEFDFALDNLEIVSGPQQRINNLRFTTSGARVDSFTWQLRPQRLGTGRVRKIQVRIEGRTFELPSQYVDVQRTAAPRNEGPGLRPTQPDPFSDPPGTSPLGPGPFGPGLGPPPPGGLPAPIPRPQPPARRPQVRLGAEVEPRQPYLGQQVLYRLYIYFQSNVQGIRPRQLPDFRGFWVQEMTVGARPAESAELGGQSYSRSILLQRALFPLRTGELELEPAAAEMEVQVPALDALGTTRSEPLERRSNRLTVTVRPLPPEPPGFRGIVGQLRLEARLEPHQLHAGEAARLTLALASSGNVQGLPAPELPVLAGLKILPPQHQDQLRTERDTIYQERTWSWVLVPEDAGTWHLPGFTMPYFDPARGRYETAATAGLQLTASPAQVLPPAPAPAAAAAPAETTTSLAWLWSLPAAGLLAAILALWYRRHRRGAARRHRDRQLLARLTAARQPDQPRRMADAIEQAWRDFLADRWQIPPTVPCDDWPHRLRAAGARPQAAQALGQLLADLHYLRNAPKLSATDHLGDEVLQHSRHLLRQLR